MAHSYNGSTSVFLTENIRSIRIWVTMRTQEEKQQAVALRRNRYSYKKISNRLNISASTVRLWLSNLELTTNEIEKLIDNNRYASILAGKNYKYIWEKRRQNLKDNYIPPFDNPRFMLGLGIYIGEGNKYNKSDTGLSTCDVYIAKIFIDWIKEFFHSDLFRLSVHHYNPNKDIEIINYWSIQLNIPTDYFNKSIFSISKSSQRKRNTLAYGTICKKYIKL